MDYLYAGKLLCVSLEPAKDPSKVEHFKKLPLHEFNICPIQHLYNEMSHCNKPRTKIVGNSPTKLSCKYAQDFILFEKGDFSVPPRSMLLICG